MSNQEDWAGYAAAYKGVLVVWIEQATDPNITATNSGGICHALTREWIEAYMRETEKRAQFVNSFRENQGKRPDGTSIPLEYIDQQEHFQSEVEGYNAALTNIQKNKTTLEAKAIRQMIELFKVQQKELYGETAVVKLFKTGTAIVDVVNSFPVHPCYVALSFRKASGRGHVVGFELRPDLNISQNYPELFEYFDANLGLFAFPARSSMIEFFLKEVWQRVYATEYAGCAFQTAVTPVALGINFGLDAELEKELNKL